MSKEKQLSKLPDHFIKDIFGHKHDPKIKLLVVLPALADAKAINLGTNSVIL